MRKFLIAAVMLLGLGSVAMAAKAPALVVKSGSIQATVDGKVQTFTAGQTIPEGAQLTATSDAVLESGGISISAPSGTTFQAARTDSGLIDVRANVGQVTVAGFGNTAVIPAGGEANMSGNNIQAIAGNIAVTTTIDGQKIQSTLAPGQQVTQMLVTGNDTFLARGANGVFNSILPPPANPKQEVAVVPVVSPSAP